MYSDFVKKKIVSSWGNNFDALNLKKAKKSCSSKNCSSNIVDEEVSCIKSSSCSKNSLLNKKVSDKKSNF